MKSIFKFDIDLIIDEYSNYVYKIINNIVGESLPYEDKEEIASDTFYLLWKNGTNIKTNLKAYLATIARNCSYEKLKQNKINLTYDEQFSLPITDDFTKLLLIKEKLNCLNNEEKKIFGLFYLEGLKIKEIAKLLKLNIGTIKIRLHRIRKKLKEEK